MRHTSATSQASMSTIRGGLRFTLMCRAMTALVGPSLLVHESKSALRIDMMRCDGDMMRSCERWCGFPGPIQDPSQSSLDGSNPERWDLTTDNEARKTGTVIYVVDPDKTSFSFVYGEEGYSSVTLQNTLLAPRSRRSSRSSAGSQHSRRSLRARVFATDSSPGAVKLTSLSSPATAISDELPNAG